MRQFVGFFKGILIEMNLGYDFFSRSEPYSFSLGVGWLPDATIRGTGLFYSIIASTHYSKFFSLQNLYSDYVTANIGWLSHHAQSLSYSFRVGCGFKNENELIFPGYISFKRRLFFINAEVEIGYFF